MKDIKTKDSSKKTIRTLDKAIAGTQKIKNEFINSKDRIKRVSDSNGESAQEYAANTAENSIESISKSGISKANIIGRNSFIETKNKLVNRAKTGQETKEQFKSKQGIKSLIKQSGTTKATVQNVSDTTCISRSIKTTDKTIKSSSKTIKTSSQNIVSTNNAVKQASKSATVFKERVKKATQSSKKTAKALASYVRKIILAFKSFITALIAGGWLATMVVVVIVLIGLVCGSVFGIFFSGEDSGNGMTMKDVVREINAEYEDKLDDIKESVEYDVLEMSGSRAVWKDVLAVYSVKVNTDENNPQEVATMNEEKKELLKDIFWEMHEIDSSTETKTETVITETDDGNGNIIETENEITQTYLYITVSHKTVDEMISQYNFDMTQQKYLAELLSEENNMLWSQVLYGIGTVDGEIVTIALSQVGNVGGQPYWSWYGFSSRVEWCACFVSWCANECGYIDAGVIPKFAGCVLGSQWFMERGQWADGTIEPTAGAIIFFDWEGDGITDHVGIVEKCENGIVYTVEGNSIGDSCRQRTYSVGSDVIYGYGLPAY